MKFPIALQPYTIRDELAKDYLGALTRVAEIGYQGVELGPPPDGITIAAFKQHIDQLGLQVIGAHARFEQLTSGLDAQIDYLHAVGGAYLGLSYRFDSRAAVLEAAQAFNQIGENCRTRGVQFVYHNHNWEFTRFDGEYAYDILLQATDSELVKLEPDTYWIQRGGADPVAYLRRLHNRCPLVHIKDMEPGEEQFFAEVGEGILDWDAIFQAAAAAGTHWLVVEQDRCRRPVFESIALSYRNLQHMGVI
jgi:sugar phosphate isomerase/epimerase